MLLDFTRNPGTATLIYMNPTMRAKMIDAIRSAYPRMIAVYLFGSEADGTAGPDSDIDVAVLFPPGKEFLPEPMEFHTLRMSLQQLMGKPVDLIDLRRASTVFQKEVIAENDPCYVADRYEVDTFEMLVLSYYCKLNEERADILDEFYRTKRAYSL